VVLTEWTLWLGHSLKGAFDDRLPAINALAHSLACLHARLFGVSAAWLASMLCLGYAYLRRRSTHSAWSAWYPRTRMPYPSRRRTSRRTTKRSPTSHHPVCSWRLPQAGRWGEGGKGRKGRGAERWPRGKRVGREDRLGSLWGMCTLGLTKYQLLVKRFSPLPHVRHAPSCHSPRTAEPEVLTKEEYNKLVAQELDERPAANPETSWREGGGEGSGGASNRLGLRAVRTRRRLWAKRTSGTQYSGISNAYPSSWCCVRYVCDVSDRYCFSFPSEFAPAPVFLPCSYARYAEAHQRRAAVPLSERAERRKAKIEKRQGFAVEAAAAVASSFDAEQPGAHGSPPAATRSLPCPSHAPSFPTKQ